MLYLHLQVTNRVKSGQRTTESAVNLAEISPRLRTGVDELVDTLEHELGE